jgi:hypothetical protein
MAAMMIEDGKRVTAGGAGFQRHITLIAEIEVIARDIGFARVIRSAFVPQPRDYGATGETLNR